MNFWVGLAGGQRNALAFKRTTLSVGVSLQVVLSALMAPGAFRGSWPCPAR